MATDSVKEGKTAREKLAEAMALVEKLKIEAAAEGIEGIVARTNIVAEYNKMKKDEEGNDIKDYVILQAIAKAVGAKGVEITHKKTPPRKRSDPNAPKKPRKPRSKPSNG
jgi:hypothetical protein